LAAPPVRILVRAVVRFVFAADVASSSIAAFIYVNGSIGRDKFKLSIHFSRGHAVFEAERLIQEAER